MRAKYLAEMICTANRRKKRRKEEKKKERRQKEEKQRKENKESLCVRFGSLEARGLNILFGMENLGMLTLLV